MNYALFYSKEFSNSLAVTILGSTDFSNSYIFILNFSKVWVNIGSDCEIMYYSMLSIKNCL